MFTCKELQSVVSGTYTDIDLKDLKTYTDYKGGFSNSSTHIKRFWEAIQGFTIEEKTLLLKFVTSCPRPPLFGFKNLHPKFTIQRVDIYRDNDQLPTASTCFNTLKLPTYSSVKVMKMKLLYVIKSGAGFDLT